MRLAEACNGVVIDHGTEGRYHASCRCQDCRAAHAAYCRARQAERLRKRAKGAATLEHGKASTYTNWHCRCNRCKLAKKLDNRARRARPAAVSIGEAV